MGQCRPRSISIDLYGVNCTEMLCHDLKCDASKIYQCNTCFSVSKPDIWKILQNLILYTDCTSVGPINDDTCPRLCSSHTECTAGIGGQCVKQGCGNCICEYQPGEHSWRHDLGLLPYTWNCGLRMHRECRERFACHRGLTIPTCITARAWRTFRDACRDR